MNAWMREAASLAQARAPQLDDEHACELAEDLYLQCLDWSPADAVGWFLNLMPRGWPEPTEEGPLQQDIRAYQEERRRLIRPRLAPAASLVQ